MSGFRVGQGCAWHMHLVYVARQLEVAVVLGEQGRAGLGRQRKNR